GAWPGIDELGQWPQQLPAEQPAARDLLALLWRQCSLPNAVGGAIADSRMKKRKRKYAARVPRETGSTSSAVSQGPARPWTAEEMRAAKPLPLPTVDPAAKARTPGAHAGKGETKPAGRPDDDEE